MNTLNMAAVEIPSRTLSLAIKTSRSGAGLGGFLPKHEGADWQGVPSSIYWRRFEHMVFCFGLVAARDGHVPTDPFTVLKPRNP